jgi:hypothetical protein
MDSDQVCVTFVAQVSRSFGVGDTPVPGIRSRREKRTMFNETRIGPAILKDDSEDNAINGGWPA